MLPASLSCARDENAAVVTARSGSPPEFKCARRRAAIGPSGSRAQRKLSHCQAPDARRRCQQAARNSRARARPILAVAKYRPEPPEALAAYVRPGTNRLEKTLPSDNNTPARRRTGPEPFWYACLGSGSWQTQIRRAPRWSIPARGQPPEPDGVLANQTCCCNLRKAIRIVRCVAREVQGAPRRAVRRWQGLR